MTKITISYRRDDSMDITGRIFDRLISLYGRDAIFRDIDSIPPGLDFREHLRKSLDDSDILLVVVGPHWMGGAARDGKPRIHSETDYVRTEVEIALKRDIPIIPLLVGAADMPEPSQLPESIRDFAYLNAMEIHSGRDFDHHMNGLIRATDGILHGATPQQSGAPERRPSDVTGTQPSSDINTRGMGEARPAGRRPRQSNIFLPVLGGAMTAQAIMHTAWFTSNLISALGAGPLERMSMDIWFYADAGFGFGGLLVGIGTFNGKHWARIGGIILCLLATFSNSLWFIEYFDKDIPRLMLAGTGFALLLFIVGIYMYVFRWPSAMNSRST